MKQLFRFWIAAALLIFAGCVEEYDDSALVGRVDDLESRVQRLEQLCQQMNTNISSLQTIVTALQNNDYVTGVTPITENGKTIGYTITFAKAQSITIYHGEDGQNGADGKDGQDGADGKDGYTPIIGVRQDTDGIYYWTLDGEWLRDNAGNRIKAVGTDGKEGVDGATGPQGEPGKDGITPMLKIEDDYWYVSYDNGASWNQLGKATGKDGKDGSNGVDGTDGKDGDSIFHDVRQDENNVYFTLADGTEITIPKVLALSIKFYESDLVVMSPNTTREIGYTVTSATETVKVEVTSSADIKAKVVADDANGMTGKIHITTGDAIDEYSKVIVFVSNGDKVIMRSITFEEAGLVVEENATKQATSEGGEMTLEFLSNVECEVVIPEDAQSWISVVPATRAMEKHTITLKLEPNEGAARSAEVIVESVDGKLSLTYTISQEPNLDYQLALEREALIALYNATGGDNWNNNENWCSNKPIRDWYGVTCNFDGYVSQLWLNNNNLVGDIPPEIGVFTCMNTIKFDKNQITSIPSEIDNLTSLGIFTLSSNPITSLPDEIGNMTNLINLDLSNTNISSLPTGFENLTNIQAIYADNCKFESFPIALCNIPGLGVIRLKNNQMSGEIPEEIGNLTNLIELDISNNNLSGQLPKNMGNLVSLIKLYAQNNQITGTIPSTFCNLSNIDLIYLMNNKMSGTIPQEIVDSDWWPILWYDIWEGNQFTEEEMIIPAPKFSAIDNYGNVVDNSIFAKHKYTVLFRFSTTDVNSVNQLPNIQYEHEAYKDTVGIYCYSLDDNAYTLSLFAESNNYTWPMFCSPKNGTQNRDIPFYSYKHRRPSISIFDNNGIMVYNHLYHSDYYEKELRTFLNKAFHFDADYESTDYSKDGEVVTLQTATEGNGIDLVLMGDGYSDRLIADGTYDDVMRTAMDKFFKIEPYKSFRHLFNVYYVKVVSKNEISVANLETALSSKFWLDALTGDNYAAINYALKAIGEERIDEAMITVILHNNKISDGICYWYNTDYLNDYGSGISISYFTYAYNKSNLEALIHHETGGHGFAKLADEYVHDDKGIIAESDVENLKESQSKRGWHKNIDFTDNLSTIRWAKFISDPRYANEDIGAYEGAYYHPYGVWRPAKTSIMVNNIGQYNAPSREAIYYRIHKLAYGDSWEYDYEEFVEWDARNRTTAATRAMVYKPANYKPTHPPVIVNKSWKDAK